MSEAAAALAAYARGVVERAAAGLQTTTGEAAAARWLDAEDATTRQVLATPELTGGLGMPAWGFHCWLAACPATGGTVLLGKCGQSPTM